MCVDFLGVGGGSRREIIIYYLGVGNLESVERKEVSMFYCFGYVVFFYV